MIKWTGTRNGRQLLGIGLEEGNFRKLREGMPIFVDGTKINLPMDLLIHSGPSKEAMLTELKALGVELPPLQDWIGAEHVDPGAMVREEERNKHALAKDEIIQILPAHKWGGCLAIVSEVKSWGVLAYVTVPGSEGMPAGHAHIRLVAGDFERIGAKATYIPADGG